MLIAKEKMAHMHGVAEYMYEHAEENGLIPDEMYILGLLHDIGYLYGSEGHEENGAALLHRMGFENHWHVLWHGTSPKDYLQYTSRENLPAELILLMEANMKIGLSGEEIGYENRLKEMANIYGLASEQYMLCEDTIQWLTEYKKGREQG